MNNEPAFPLNELQQTTGDVSAQHFGLTIRDYFAAKAMQGELAAMQDSSGVDIDISHEGLARLATLWYRIADAMMAARAVAS